MTQQSPQDGEGAIAGLTAPRRSLLWLTKRRYMKKDLRTDGYGRYFEVPKRLSEMGQVRILCLDYHGRTVERKDVSASFGIRSFSEERNSMEFMIPQQKPIAGSA